MYNLHQFSHRHHQEQGQYKRKQQEQAYKSKHQEYKQYASQNVRRKAHSFISAELSSAQPFVFEDDHYQRWRNHRVHRDIQNPQKFKGEKSFRHKLNSDMDKYYSERERREMKYLVNRKEELVNKGIIPKQHISRSLLSQGPYNPKLSFRQIKKDEQYLQPRLRFSNVTDFQRVSQSSMHFDQRVSSIYSKFQQKKQKLGQQKSSLQALPTSKSAIYQLDKQNAKSLSLQSNCLSPTKQSQIQGIPLSKSYKLQGISKKKTHFKLAKMMSLFDAGEGKQKIQQLLKRSQFERRKDLSNIRSNSFNQNYQKRPIL